LPLAVRPYLEQILDWKDLIKISHHMIRWEEDLCIYLELTDVDIDDIKAKYPSQPELQR
jgi:hypothetical protein